MAKRLNLNTVEKVLVFVVHVLECEYKVRVNCRMCERMSVIISISTSLPVVCVAEKHEQM